MRRILVTCLLLFAGTAYGQGAPTTYKFTTDYYYVDLKGHVDRRERIAGFYTRDLFAKSAKWNNVTMSTSTDRPDTLGPASKRTSMEGFSYALGAADMTKAEFFRDLRDSTMQDQNLVWDMGMFEVFGEKEFSHLAPNTTYHLPETDVPLAGAGNFHNKDVQLTWSGITKRNGQDCATIDYRALFNTLELQLPGGLKLIGRSHYWGQIVVSLATKQIVEATLYEDVLGEISIPGQPTPQPVNVFRIGVLEPAH